jgi:hypothetical protein
VVFRAQASWVAGAAKAATVISHSRGFSGELGCRVKVAVDETRGKYP